MWRIGASTMLYHAVHFGIVIALEVFANAPFLRQSMAQRRSTGTVSLSVVRRFMNFESSAALTSMHSTPPSTSPSRLCPRRSDRDRFDRPYMHPITLPHRGNTHLHIKQQRFGSEGFASTGVMHAVPSLHLKQCMPLQSALMVTLAYL